MFNNMYCKYIANDFENPLIELFVEKSDSDMFCFFGRGFSNFPQDDFIKGEMG